MNNLIKTVLNILVHNYIITIPSVKHIVFMKSDDVVDFAALSQGLFIESVCACYILPKKSIKFLGQAGRLKYRVDLRECVIIVHAGSPF